MFVLRRTNQIKIDNKVDRRKQHIAFLWLCYKNESVIVVIWSQIKSPLNKALSLTVAKQVCREENTYKKSMPDILQRMFGRCQVG